MSGDNLRRSPSGPRLKTYLDTLTFTGGETQAFGALNDTTGIVEEGDILVGTPYGTNSTLVESLVLTPTSLGKVYHITTLRGGASAGVLSIAWTAFKPNQQN